MPLTISSLLHNHLSMLRRGKLDPQDPVTMLAVRQAVEVIHAVPDPDTLHDIVTSNPVISWPVGLAEIACPPVWAALAEKLGDRLPSFHERLATALSEKSRMSPSILRQMLHEARGGKSAPLRMMIALHALRQSDAALIAEIHRAGPFKPPYFAHLEDSLLPALGQCDAPTAAAFVSRLDEQTLTAMLELAVRKATTNALPRLLRAARRLDQLPAVGPETEPETRAIITEISSAHAFLRWRQESRAWLAEHAADSQRAISNAHCDGASAPLTS